MRIFVYKFLIIVTGIFILYQVTIGYTVFKLQQKLFSLNSKENSIFVKDKIRKELIAGLKKDKIFNEKDRILIKKLYKKIYLELQSLN
tara:strand:- start:292 stop:555 length:264 start_codon:yes stop_codon:yes gene_type:complete